MKTVEDFDNPTISDHADDNSDDDSEKDLMSSFYEERIDKSGATGLKVMGN